MEWRHFKSHHWLVLVAIALALLLATLHIAGLLGIFLRGLKADASGWAEAIGTIGAVAVALRLASDQARTKRQEDLTRAVIMAGAASTEIEHWRRELDFLVNELPKTYQNDGLDLNVKRIRVALSAIRGLDTGQLLLLAPVGLECSTRIARVGGLVSQANHAFEKGVPFIGVPADFDIRQMWHQMALEAARDAYADVKTGQVLLADFIVNSGGGSV